MTAGDIYTVGGTSATGPTIVGDGDLVGESALSPTNMTFDSSGDLYIADTSNNRIQEVPASMGTQWGISMTVGHIYTVAGSATGASGDSSDGTASTFSARRTSIGGWSTRPEICTSPILATT